MSNKKQSSIDWFQEQIIKIVNGTCELSEIQIFEQAKEMHKDEVEDAYFKGYADNMNDEGDFEQYYTKTFGGNNE